MKETELVLKKIDTFYASVVTKTKAEGYFIFLITNMPWLGHNQASKSRFLPRLD